MSVRTSQEHSHLKVLFDFQYKTADGREIAIRKNERLYLLQKTNADWWQVVRNFEQRSFYVPAGYVREVSKSSGSSTRKNSEEEREGNLETPQDPSYKSMPKETSSAMRNVKKWLAGAIDGKSEASKSLYDPEVQQKSEATDNFSKGRLRVGLADTKTKSLERDRRSGHSSDREEDTIDGSPRSRDSGEYHEDSSSRVTNRFSTSPKTLGTLFKIEASLQEPFRRELESSLDRRNLSGKLGGRIRTRSMNSEGSNVDSDGGEARETSENPTRYERRSNLSIHEELPSDDRRSSGASRQSGSSEVEGNRSLSRGERSVSPKPIYGRQMTIAGGNTAYQEKKISSSDGAAAGGTADHKILNDKRRTWAVEELMSELTQMCKERVTNKKPAFQLKSTEVKTNFDPIEKLTREIHEMNRMRAEANAAEIGDSPSAAKCVSPTNVCKISINTSSSPTAMDAQSSRRDSIAREEQAEMRARKNSNVAQSESDSVRSSSPKSLKSPKSPKILDEYNEANILNDCNSSEGISRNVQQSLSPDKRSHYHKLSSPSHPEADEPCYSNVKINAEKTRARPKLWLKSVEPSVELKLTPSLEKLASEIQFLPANRSGQTPENVEAISRSSTSAKDGAGAREPEASYSDESLERRAYRPATRNDQRELHYKGSFKTKREAKYDDREYFENPDQRDPGGKKKRGLKKSSTLNCATIPNCYRRWRKHEPADRFETVMENSASYKRRSRSLSDLEALELKFFDDRDKHDGETTGAPRYKPVPLPRTKIPALEIHEGRTNVDKSSPKIIVGRTKTRGDKTDERHDDAARRKDQHDVSGYSNFDTRQDDSADFSPRRNVDIQSSTAVGFKSLLCASDSGSDNCLQSKELLSNSTSNINDQGSFRAARKSNSSVNFNGRARPTRESLSDDQILSSNASSEALHSESEVTATLDVSSQPSPIKATASQDSFECAIDLPPGWKQIYDSDIGQICFLNEQGDKWFSSSDAEGKIYFFEENSNESSWVLPPIDSDKCRSINADGRYEKVESNNSTSEINDSGSISSNVLSNQSIAGRESSTRKVVTTGGDWPHLCDGNNMLVLKEGVINRTKITENGKKLRKNWSTSYAVLTELFLLFFKDAKTFTMMKTGQSSMAKPDISVDLNGALVEPGERASSRKNVYMISTVLGLQVLVQSDNTGVATEWFQEIHGAIRKLPSGFKSQGKALPIAADIRKISGGKQPTDINLHEDSKKLTKVARSRSMKMKRLDDSLEDLSGSAAERQTKIKAKLRRFFQRRPAVELLVKNGIYKDEPAFGSYLSDVCPTEPPRVPLFVKTCIEVLESNEENMKTDGLYRASGNLSQIQKIRLQVDQYKLDVLAQEEDVHVLAGALKLFFRELKEPLIPSSFFKEAINASMLKKTSAKIQCFREIVKALPPPNYDTLQFLLKHLLRVTSYQEFNRMHIPNLAIVFGPTLMWPAEESANMALDFMQQNLVIECLLSEYNKIFK